MKFVPLDEVAAAKGDRKRRQSFYTPMSLAKRMAGWLHVRGGMRVLEPSAGDGRLVHCLQQEALPHVLAIDCYEIDATLRDRLAEMGHGVRVLGGDFLAADPRPDYDRVIMNPPFTNRAFEAHVQHAYAFLKPGGQLCALVPETAAECVAQLEWKLPGCQWATYEALDPKDFPGVSVRIGVVEMVRGYQPGDHGGYANIATEVAATAIENDRELIRLLAGCNDTVNVERLRRALVNNGCSPYGVNWFEVVEQVLGAV